MINTVCTYWKTECAFGYGTCYRRLGINHVIFARSLSILRIATMVSEQRKRVRYTFDVCFMSQQQKDDFKARLGSVRDLLSPQGGPKLDNLGLMTALFELAEACHGGRSGTTESLSDSRSFLPNSGKKWLLYSAINK